MRRCLPLYFFVYNKRTAVPIACRLQSCVLLVALFGSPAVGAAEPGLTVFAAASLQNALEEISAAQRRAGGAPARLAFAASSTLARQIERGAPADVYVSADLAWMDYLAERGRIVEGSRVIVARNRLVLIAPAARAAPLAVKPGFPLLERLGEGRLALGDPAHVPAGRYAKAALESLGLWASLAERLAPVENVRVALALVARGEAPLGIVYASDVVVEPGVRVVGTFPPGSHPPIVYPAALVAGGARLAAGRYLAFLRSATARAAFARQGFLPAE
jgi:molybdate transport system substrate-binding protein